MESCTIYECQIIKIYLIAYLCDTSYIFQLFVNTNIPQELNVTFNWKQMTVKVDEEVLFILTWTPLSPESVRYILTFEDLKKIKRDVPVAFKSISVEVRKYKMVIIFILSVRFF